MRRWGSPTSLSDGGRDRTRRGLGIVSLENRVDDRDTHGSGDRDLKRTVGCYPANRYRGVGYQHRESLESLHADLSSGIALRIGAVYGPDADIVGILRIQQLGVAPE